MAKKKTKGRGKRPGLQARSKNARTKKRKTQGFDPRVPAHLRGTAKRRPDFDLDFSPARAEAQTPKAELPSSGPSIQEEALRLGSEPDVPPAIEDVYV